MKRKILIVNVLFCLIIQCYSQDKYIVNDYWYKDIYVIHNDKLYHYNELTNEKNIITNFVINKNRFGYYQLTIENKITNYVPNYPYTELDIRQLNNSQYQLPYSDIGIKYIKSSSFLREKFNGTLFEYKADNLLKRFVKEAESFYLYNVDAMPWVEGQNDFGRDEYLDITFTQEQDTILLLNGYVDFTKQSLFMDNNRLKSINITSLDQKNKFVINVSLEDGVLFSVIKLPHLTNRIKLSIIDVYKGTKYNDTCISAIIALKSSEMPAIDTKEIISEFN
jgi:hypothetical protein